MRERGNVETFVRTTEVAFALNSRGKIHPISGNCKKLGFEIRPGLTEAAANVTLSSFAVKIPTGLGIAAATTPVQVDG